MAGLRVFVSSTCYDLSLLRENLREFIQSIGFDPIMSDYGDVLYDPRTHTHTSCVDEVKNCDILVFIIGSRFGGKAKDEALEKVDFDKIQKEGIDIDALKKSGKCSITQLEVLKAIEESIPIYTFIDKKVWHYHELYEQNKRKKISDKIIFPSIENQKTAKYIFEFINTIRLKPAGNSITIFENVQELEDSLKRQWSSYFQRLLGEQRHREEKRKEIDILNNQFEDLKTAILSSMNDNSRKEIARGVLRYRRLLDFLLALAETDLAYLKTSKDNWKKMFSDKYGIADIIEKDIDGISYGVRRSYLIKKDNKGFYVTRIPKEVIDFDFKKDWESFIKLSNENRDAILEALSETNRGSFITVKYISKKFDEYVKDKEIENGNKLF